QQLGCPYRAVGGGRVLSDGGVLADSPVRTPSPPATRPSCRCVGQNVADADQTTGCRVLTCRSDCCPVRDGEAGAGGRRQSANGGGPGDGEDQPWQTQRG